MAKKLILLLILLTTSFSFYSYSQEIVAPFVAQLNFSGEPDISFNNGSYSSFVNIRPDRAVRAVDFLKGDQGISYLCGSIVNTSNSRSSPLVIKLIQSKPDPNYVPGFGYAEVDPKADYFNSYETFSAEYQADKGVVLFGNGIPSSSDIYPFSFKINERGFLDNFYREGGSFFLLEHPKTRIKASAINSNMLAGVIESYTNGTKARVFTSSLNGNNLKVGNDTIPKIEDPIISIYNNALYLAATTKMPPADFIKDGGLTIAKFDVNGNLVTSFGDQGKILIPFTSSKFQPASMTIVNDKIYVAGKMGANGIAVARLNINGTLDETFAGDGISVRYLVGPNIMYGDMMVTDPFVYITGSYGKSFFLYRLNLDGSLEPSSASFEYSSLHNAQGTPIPSDKIERLAPFKIVEVGTGTARRIIIAGNATVKR